MAGSGVTAQGGGGDGARRPSLGRGQGPAGRRTGPPTGSDARCRGRVSRLSVVTAG